MRRALRALFTIFIYELSIKNLTAPFASATPISCNMVITLLSEYIFATFWHISLVRVRRKSVNPASGQRTAPTIVFSDHDFL